MSSGELTVMFRRTPDVSAKGNHAFGNLVRQMNHVRQTTCVGVSDTPTPTPSYRGTMVIKGVRQFHLVTPYDGGLLAEHGIPLEHRRPTPYTGFSSFASV